MFRLVYLSGRMLRPLWRVYARLRRARVHRSVVMNGRPLIRCVRGGELILEAGVILNSSPAANPVIGRSRLALSVLSPGGRLVLDRDVGASGVCISAAKEVIVGEGTMIGADALITDTDFHLPLPGWRWCNAFAETAQPVRIGRGCFIGARAIILKGVTLGDGAVVGAGAVVTRDVPAGHMAAGNPAQIRPLSAKWRRPAVD